MVAYRHILVPVDFSPLAWQAWSHARDLAALCRAHVTLLHVLQIEPLLTTLVDAQFPVPISDVHVAKARARAAERLESLIPVDERRRLELRVAVVEGTPFVEIVRFARAHNVDCIVMATHGYSGVKHLLIGSTAERVVRKSPCPVLTVRPEGQEFLAP